MFCCQDCRKAVLLTGYHATRLESKLCDDCEPNWTYTEDAGYVPECDAYYSEMRDAYYSYDYDAENRGSTKMKMRSLRIPTTTTTIRIARIRKQSDQTLAIL